MRTFEHWQTLTQHGNKYQVLYVLLSHVLQGTLYVPCRNSQRTRGSYLCVRTWYTTRASYDVRDDRKQEENTIQRSPISPPPEDYFHAVPSTLGGTAHQKQPPPNTAFFSVNASPAILVRCDTTLLRIGCAGSRAAF